MKASQKILLASLLLLLAAAVAGVFLTRDTGRPATLRRQQNKPASSQSPLVDEQPLRTARFLAPLALTPDERPLAREAVRIAFLAGAALFISPSGAYPARQPRKSPAIYVVRP